MAHWIGSDTVTDILYVPNPCPLTHTVQHKQHQLFWEWHFIHGELLGAVVGIALEIMRMSVIAPHRNGIRVSTEQLVISQKGTTDVR